MENWKLLSEGCHPDQAQRVEGSQQTNLLPFFREIPRPRLGWQKQTRCLSKTAIFNFQFLILKWNNPWLSGLLWFPVCQGLFRWVLGFCHWLTSLSAVCDLTFLSDHCFREQYFYLSLLLHFLCLVAFIDALTLFETEVRKVWSLAIWGETYLYIGITSSELSRSFCLVSSSLWL